MTYSISRPQREASLLKWFPNGLLRPFSTTIRCLSIAVVDVPPTLIDFFSLQLIADLHHLINDTSSAIPSRKELLFPTFIRMVTEGVAP